MQERQASSHTIGLRRTSTRVRGRCLLRSPCHRCKQPTPRGAICQRRSLELHSALYGYNIAEHMDYARRIQAVAGRRHKTDSEKRTDESSLAFDGQLNGFPRGGKTALAPDKRELRWQ